MNTVMLSEDLENGSKEIKTEVMDDIDIKPENLHHSVDIKEEPSTNESKLDLDGNPFTCKQFVCLECNTLCTDKLQLIEHTNIHTAAKQFTVMASSTHTLLFSCNRCEYRTYEMASLDCHLEIHSDGTLPCCEVKERAHRHFFEIHSNHGTSFQCKTCDLQCSIRADMEGHIKTHIPKPFTCNICDYKCSNKTQWQRHLRTHTGEKPYVCHICAFKFIDVSALNRHIRSHTGDKPFQCSICNLKLSGKKHLKRHLQIHTGERPFTCHICNCKFGLKTGLNRHLRIHTGVKPFECKFCDYKTAVKQVLINHVRIHTGEKPYECTICDYKCSIKQSLTHHMQTHTRTQKKRSKCNV